MVGKVIGKTIGKAANSYAREANFLGLFTEREAHRSQIRVSLVVKVCIAIDSAITIELSPAESTVL